MLVAFVKTNVEVLKARFLRWCHLMYKLPGLFRDDVHRAVTTTRPVLLSTLSIECDCGKVFWKRKVK